MVTFFILFLQNKGLFTGPIDISYYRKSTKIASKSVNHCFDKNVEGYFFANRGIRKKHNF